MLLDLLLYHNSSTVKRDQKLGLRDIDSVPSGLLNFKFDYVGAILPRNRPQHSLSVLVSACTLVVAEASSLAEPLLICEVLVLSVVGDCGDVRVRWVHQGHILYPGGDSTWA